MIETIQADWIKSEAINLENCCNDNPLKILGPHLSIEARAQNTNYKN